jgi:DNA-binding LacI/PurR family transcriptional regulator
MGIRQLAHELQLSIGTVSRALNDRPDVNDETRARVKEAAIRAGYVPNQSGRSLRSGKTGIVAAVIPTRTFASTTDSGLFHILEGTRRTLRRHALDLIVLFRGPEEDALDNLQRTVQRRIADAVILSQTTAADPRLAYLNACGMDYVAFGRASGIEDYPFVDFDFESMARQTVRLFAADGHRRIGVAVSDPVLNYEAITVAELRAEAGRLGLGPDAVEVLPTIDGRLTAAGLARFADRSTAPTAILATHECIAATLYADLARLGLEIGKGVSVICTFPAIDTLSLVPALSHFTADLDAVGIALAETLVGLLLDVPYDQRSPRTRLVPLVFAPRASHGRAVERLTA